MMVAQKDYAAAVKDLQAAINKKVRGAWACSSAEVHRPCRCPRYGSGVLLVLDTLSPLFPPL